METQAAGAELPAGAEAIGIAYLEGGTRTRQLQSQESVCGNTYSSQFPHLENGESYIPYAVGCADDQIRKMSLERGLVFSNREL